MTSSVDDEPELTGGDDFARSFAHGATTPWLPQEGTVLGGRYCVERHLGEGGFGNVYEAMETSGSLSGRRVAVKFVWHGRRFVDHEIDALKGLSHSNVITVLDAGMWQPDGRPDAVPFLVMELLEGRTLARGGRTPEDAFAIGRQLADALAHMHAKGVYHLDLKPENLFASKGGTVVILDLGIAKVLESEPTQRPEDEPSAPEWAGCGTPPYAAPEQLDSKRWAEVDGRADVHAFGMLLGELLTGHAPRLPPGAPTLEEQMASVDARLVALIARCVKVDPSQRFSNGEALLQALGEIRLGQRAPLAPGEDPFRALRPFETCDKGLFFGRDREVQDLVSLVTNSRLVVLHGASGTGKTSLLRAGLRPALGAKFLWLDLPAPTETTFELGDAIVARAAEELRGLGRDLGESEPDRALAVVAEAAQKPVLVVLDQFEELFQRRTIEQIGETAMCAADTLRKVGRVTADVRVLISLRDDYMGHLRHLQAGLPGIFERGLLLSALDHSGARQAIEEPFRLGGVGISSALAERMVTELDKEARETGPVQLQILCDELYRAARLLQQMLAAGGNRQPPQGVRRIAEGAGLSVPDAQRAMKGLVDGRLVEASDRTVAKPRVGTKKKKRSATAEREPVFRIAHDLVARAVWEKLEEQEARDVELRDGVRALARQVPEGRVDRAFWFAFGLKARTREELLGWARRDAPGATNEDRAFLRHVGAWTRRIRGGKIAGAVMAAAALIGGGVLFYQARVQARADQARARELEAQKAEAEAERELQHDPGKALTWIAEAARIRGRIEHEPDHSYHEHWLAAREAWSEGIGWVAADHGREVLSVAFSPPELVWMDATGAASCEHCWPHRKLLVSAGNDGSVRVLDLEKGGLAEPLPSGGKTAASHVAFSPDGRWVAASDIEGAVRVWDVIKREPPSVLRFPESAEGRDVVFSYDATWLAVGSVGGEIAVWHHEKDTWASNAPIRAHQAPIMQLAFSPHDPALLASSDAHGHVFLTDLHKRFDGGAASSEDLPLPSSDTKISRGLAFSNDGTMLAATIGSFAAAFRRITAEPDSTSPRWEPFGKPVDTGVGMVTRLSAIRLGDVWIMLTGRGTVTSLGGHAKRTNGTADASRGILTALKMWSSAATRHGYYPARKTDRSTSAASAPTGHDPFGGTRTA